ncbi:hypothetical protein CL619_05005 [archaeon]|nr:hypothetical protein [archaeon]
MSNKISSFLVVTVLTCLVLFSVAIFSSGSANVVGHAGSNEFIVPDNTRSASSSFFQSAAGRVASTIEDTINADLAERDQFEFDSTCSEIEEDYYGNTVRVDFYKGQHTNSNLITYKFSSCFGDNTLMEVSCASSSSVNVEAVSCDQGCESFELYGVDAARCHSDILGTAVLS